MQVAVINIKGNNSQSLEGLQLNVTVYHIYIFIYMYITLSLHSPLHASFQSLLCMRSERCEIKQISMSKEQNGLSSEKTGEQKVHEIPVTL